MQMLLHRTRNHQLPGSVLTTAMSKTVLGMISFQHKLGGKQAHRATYGPRVDDPAASAGVWPRDDESEVVTDVWAVWLGWYVTFYSIPVWNLSYDPACTEAPVTSLGVHTRDNYFKAGLTTQRRCETLSDSSRLVLLFRGGGLLFSADTSVRNGGILLLQAGIDFLTSKCYPAGYLLFDGDYIWGGILSCMTPERLERYGSRSLHGRPWRERGVVASLCMVWAKRRSK